MFRLIKNNIVILIALPIIIVLFILIKNSTASDVFTDPEATDKKENLKNTLTSDFDILEQDSNLLIVDIKGEVKRPGVYEFETGDRVNDLILKSGGFLDSADETQVNLAQKLQDEMIVIVPQKGDEYDVSPHQDTSDQAVRVNYATTDQLETLPGIGPSKAKAILDYRDEHGFFSSKEDLLNISGIGEKTLENITDHIQIP